ncbi:MAG: XRE family transcriptional regulator [Ectothiorhodospiraceae bacterium]|nr:XRE family transcriptional regulator [Ectothiorhodospiraceae bacterium]
MDAKGELKMKADLVVIINQAIDKCFATQELSAKEFGITQPQISDLKHGRLDHFSIKRLFRILNDLGMDVEIRVQKKSSRVQNAKVSVVNA